MYIRSFADADGDGLGDVEGMRSRLPYLASLGVDAVWINPWYPSPQADGGYDVADYRDVEPAFGTLDDGQRFIDDAHAHGIRVILDIVPNHTSDQHAWFVAALAAGPGLARACPLHLPARAGRRRRTAAERLGGDVRRAGLGAGDRTGRVAGGVVPPPVRRRAARPQLGQPRGARRVPRRPAVLVRTWCRRIPDRRRPRV